MREAEARYGVGAVRLYGAAADTLLSKITAPLRNMMMMTGIRRDDVVWINSSSFCYLLPLALLLRLSGRRVIAIHHLFIYHEQKGLRRMLYRIMEAMMLRSASKVLTPSPYLAKELRRRTGRTPLLLPIPFAPRAIAEPDGERLAGRLLYVATIEPRKGPIYLVEAMKILKQRSVKCSLDMLGSVRDQATEEAILKEIRDCGLDITIHGHADRKTVERFMDQSDIFVFPSLYEGFGMAPNEAMQSGLPVVCFRNSAMPYSVKDGVNGLMVSTGDTEALADAIERIIIDRPLRARLSAGALAHAATLPSHEDFRHSFLRIVRALIPHHHKPHHDPHH